MQRIIAVEENLTNVNQALRSAGFETVSLDENSKSANLGAIVVSGQDQNFMGMHDISTKVPVISAEGRSAQEVVDLVRNRMA